MSDSHRTSNERSLADRLFDAQVASCSCLTKTHEHQYHDPMCHYRLFYEAWLALSNAVETNGCQGQRAVGQPHAFDDYGNCRFCTAVKTKPAHSEPWTCPKCQQLNSAGSSTCGRCEDL